jgi:outer membrane protein assembly factor BamB
MKNENIQIINPFIYSDQKNTSYIPVDTKFSGGIKWKLSKPENVYLPSQIVIFKDLLIVNYGLLIKAYTCLNGKEVWEQPVNSIKAFLPTGNKLFSLKPKDQVSQEYEKNPASLIDLNNGTVTDISIPYHGYQSKFHFVSIQNNLITYVYSRKPPLLDGFGEYRKDFHFTRYDMKSNSIVHTFDKSIFMRGVAFSEKELIFCFADNNGFYSFQPLNNTEPDRIDTITLIKTEIFSLDHNNDLLVINKAGKQNLQDEIKSIKLRISKLNNSDTEKIRSLHKKLTKLEKKLQIHLSKINKTGKLLWTMKLPTDTRLHQPPGSSPDGTVYLISDSNIFTILNGSIVWKYKLPVKYDSNMLTVLSDNSVLATNNSTLIHLSSKGKILKIIDLKQKITCRPVVDYSRNVVVGCENGIYYLH